MTSVRDIIILVVILFAVGISIMMAVLIGHEVNENLLVIPAMNSTPEAVEVIESADRAIDTADYIYLASFVGFYFAIIVFAWFIGGHPIMSPIFFFLVVIFVFVAIVLQLAWIDISTTTQFVSTVARLPITNFILAHLGYFTAIFGLTAILIMFAKPGDQ